MLARINALLQNVRANVVTRRNHHKFDIFPRQEFVQVPRAGFHLWRYLGNLLQLSPFDSAQVNLRNLIKLVEGSQMTSNVTMLRRENSSDNERSFACCHCMFLQVIGYKIRRQPTILRSRPDVHDQFNYSAGGPPRIRARASSNDSAHGLWIRWTHHVSPACSYAAIFSGLLLPSWSANTTSKFSAESRCSLT